jgi:hypothetical protein
MMKNLDLASQFPPGSEADARNLAIDFDGVIHDDYLGFHDGTCYGQVIDGSAEALELLAKHFRIVIFTAKAKSSRPKINGKTGESLVWEWLREKKLDIYVSEVTAEKPRAIAYIDDKAIRFTSWSDIFSKEFFMNL